MACWATQLRQLPVGLQIIAFDSDMQHVSIINNLHQLIWQFQCLDLQLHNYASLPRTLLGSLA